MLVSLFNKVAGPRPVTLLKKRLCHRCFPMNFVKFLRIPFFIEHLQCDFLIGYSHILKHINLQQLFTLFLLRNKH